MNNEGVFVSMTDTGAPFHPIPILPLLPHLLVLIPWDVSVAHVCECQWEAALWLFYELHYWFPILLRRENVIMHRPHPNPPPPCQTTLLCLPSFLSFTQWFFINLSFTPPLSTPPHLPSHHLTCLKPLCALSFVHVMLAKTFPKCLGVIII